MKHGQTLSQSEFQTGLQDGTRYRVDGHEELIDRYHRGTHAYKLGWDSSQDYPRVKDPDYAT